MNNIYNINRRKFLGFFGCCACSLIIPSCSTVPITDRKQLKLLPESSINRQAAQLNERVKMKVELSDNHKQLSEIKEIGVVGAGQMGRGIAQVAAMSGYKVKVFDISKEGLDFGLNFISKQLEKGMAKGKGSVKRNIKEI